jgi:phosphoenolpyruvate carboxykinase (diphosphate)
MSRLADWKSAIRQTGGRRDKPNPVSLPRDEFGAFALQLQQRTQMAGLREATDPDAHRPCDECHRFAAFAVSQSSDRRLLRAPARPYVARPIEMSALRATPVSERKLWQYINLKLAALGCPTAKAAEDAEFEELVHALLQHQRETERLLADYLCPADWRIQQFLDDYLYETGLTPKLPSRTFILDRPGVARAMSLPPDEDVFKSDILTSYRVKQGVLHNPKSDRRTTEGVFHVAEGGLPVPDDKRAVPKRTFAEMLARALTPPPESMRVPFTSSQADEARCFVSLLLRPLVVPEVPGFIPEKRMETRFFAPATLVSNLDFVETIFGNGGDPFLPENDAGLDVDHWTGHTGCVILAPHLVRVKKREVGLPHWDKATERQRRDGMCWKNEEDLYNNGVAFKLTARDERGVMVTIIADNYFGYCKKEVKTQISYTANLFGLAEEEHAGGALVFPSYDLGEEMIGRKHMPRLDYSFDEVVKLYGAMMEVRPEGYAVDKANPSVIYVSEHVQFDLRKQLVSWPHGEGMKSMKLLPGKVYVRPSGYKVHMERIPGTKLWRLVGTVGEGVFCHKPCTVSGGGKSEISKSISDSILQGPVFVSDFKKDFDAVADLLKRDYGNRFRDSAKNNQDSRPILSPERSIGSVIKLLTPASREYSAEYNAWLRTIPQHVKELVFVVKRFYKPEWGDDWRSRFSVDIINGVPGNELKFENRKLLASYVRVGYEQDGSWRTFGLRSDFHPAEKIQMEDDITASVVVPTEKVSGLNPQYRHPAVKFARNCENRLFQRPDDAVHRGYDKQAELDFSQAGNFFSNYEPLTLEHAKEMLDDVIAFSQYTEPVQGTGHYLVATSHPRVIDGKPTKNPRYLQPRPDLANPRDAYVADVSMRFQRRIPLTQSFVPKPVNVVVPGRRNNPPESGIRSLAVYNPVHYMELPELFMEFICSMTGKSPSTTGAGSEGAMTKGPFNALPPIFDLNDALVSYLLTGHEGFVTAAGYVGPHARVDHDVSLLIPEIFSRMTVEERDPKFLIRNNYLEKCRDLEHGGKSVLASRLGYRITARFVRTFFGRMFNHPDRVFTDAMLKPETQDLDVFADGMDNIVSTQKRVAQHYFNDGSVELAVPPLKALLHIMLRDEFEGRDLSHAKIRTLFTRENMLASEWYAERLRAKQAVDARLWQRHVSYLTKFVTKTHYADEVARLGIEGRLDKARAELKRVNAPGYLEELRGTLGANPLPKSAAQEQAELAITSSATNTPSARQTVAVT